MAQEQREREDKYDVGPRFSMPALDDLVPVGGRLEREVVHLDSEYYDTEHHDLLSGGVTLRRRSGDTDVGWQLKIPEGKARTEIRLPANGPAVPDELADLVRALRQDRPLAQIARVRTERTVTRLRASDDSAVVEIADDTVHGTAPGDNALLTQWREIEVELGTGDVSQLDSLRKRLGRAGARPSRSSSKLARALDDEVEQPREDESAGGAVTTYLRRQYAELVAGDVALRRHRDAIHSTRVATRRIRSTLRVFAPLFDQRRATRLDAELLWYAGLLGDVRDRQVQRAAFADAIEDLPDDLVVASFAEDLDAWLESEQQARSRDLEAALNSERYLRLFRDVRDWAQATPFTENAGAPLSTLKDLAEDAGRKADKRRGQAVRAARSDGDDQSVNAAMHRARKAAKRARYAVELASPAYSAKRAKKIIKQYKQRQNMLGEHQDAVVGAQLLRDHAAHADPPPPFTYGLLLARTEAMAKRTRKRATRA